ncbi:MAG TPA: YihY/virulence factor BrkB family protein [Vicinamibacterales bacterium]|nr:YihY/virulence factor BrkB family protein [Vicinamibacterales bacterium]
MNYGALARTTTPTLMRSWRIFLQAGGLWLERNAFVHAGSLAFYTLFSLAPVVIIAVAIAGAVFGDEAARGQIVTQLEGFVGSGAARAVEEAVARSRPEVAGLLPTVTGILALVLGATTVFAQMQISLNRIWGVASRPQKSGIPALVKNRLVSLAIILAIGFVLLVSLLLTVALRAVLHYAEGWVPIPPLVLTLTELVLSLVLITSLFAIIFKVLPDAVVDWRDVWTGAAITAALFVIGRYVIAFYLAYTAPASIYGAAGSLVLLLLWVYYSSLILFFGAALTKARVLSSGRPIVPRATAVLVKEEIVEDEPVPEAG